MAIVPEITFQFNLGTLIPVGVALLALANWTGSLDNKIVNLEMIAQSNDPRIRALENAQATTSAHLDAINNIVVEIKEMQKETNVLLRDVLRSKP